MASWLRHPGNNVTAIHRIALLTMSEHFAPHHLTVKTPDPRELERSLSDELPFSVVVPDLGKSFELVGGRRCSIGSHPAAYSSWRSQGRIFSLYQFVPSAFGLAGHVERTTVPGNVSRCQVEVWTDGGRGFALVGSHG